MLNSIEWWWFSSGVIRGMESHLFCYYSHVHSDNTYLGSIYGSNISIWKLFILDKNTWNHVNMYKWMMIIIRLEVSWNNIFLYNLLRIEAVVY